MHEPSKLCRAMVAIGAAGLAACSDHPITGPDESPPLRPTFDVAYPGTSNVCRQFGNGFAQVLISGSFFQGACPIQAIETPSPYMGSSNPGPITITFDQPVTHVIGRVMYACEPFCPTAHMTFTAWRPDGTKIADQQPLTGGPNGFGQIVYGWDVPDDEAVSKLSVTPPVPMPPDVQPGYAFVFEFDYAVPCPTPDDSVLADPSVQHRLNEEWALSNSEGKERGGWIYRNTTTGEYLVWADPNAAPRNRCSVNFSPIPQPPAGYVPVRIWHTHIVRPGTPYGNLIPECGDLYPAEAPVENSFSPIDRAKTEAAALYPHFLIDENELFIQYPRDQGGGEFDWPWINGCRQI